MTKHWQTIRVFISSTFRDMHSERDYLVKVVFPKLRERLEAYQFHLEDVDLRWGVTAEQANNDMALDLCLQQIDESRPFFVGILGERYGFVPQSFTDEAVSKYGWIQAHTGKSLTELEILYGVLRKPEMKGHAFLYFRDKAFAEDVPAWKQSDVLSEDANAAEKLHALKEAIRRSDSVAACFDGYPCRYAGLKVNTRILKLEVGESDWEAIREAIDGGCVALDAYERLAGPLKDIVRRSAIVYLDELRAFGDRVFEQLWQAIQSEYGLAETPPLDTLAQDNPLAYEGQFHERFMESRTRVYIGRERIQQELMDYVRSDANVPCLVTGPSGSGKSAALAKFAHTMAAQHPETLLIPHFVGASFNSTGLRHMLLRFCQILNQASSSDTPIPTDVCELTVCFRELLRDGSIPPIVLVIDALNQMDESDHAHYMNWLPLELYPHVKVVVSCVDDPDQQQEVLRTFSYRDHCHIEIGPLSRSECQEIAREVPSLSAKSLDTQQVELLLDNGATTSPMFLWVVLEELRGFGSFEHLNDRIRQLPRGPDANIEVFVQVIGRLLDEFDPRLVAVTLCNLACSRNGLTEQELLELAQREGGIETPVDAFAILRQLRSYLQYRGRTLSFADRGLSEAVRRTYLDTDEKNRAVHARLARYFRSKVDPEGDSVWSGHDTHGLSVLPYHLSKCGNRSGYERTLLDYRFIRRKLDVFGVQPLIDDYHLHTAERNSPLDLLCNSLELSRRTLEGDKNQLAGHLLGRLLGHNDHRIQRLLGQARQCQTGTWLRPLCANLVSAGSPMIRSLEGHKDHITCFALTSDGRVVSASEDATLKIWDLATGTCLRTLTDDYEGHRRAITCLALTSDGRIVSGSWDKTLCVWDAGSGEHLMTLGGHTDFITDVVYTSNGLVVSMADDNTVRVWDLTSIDSLRTLDGETYEVAYIALSSEGYALSTSDDGTLKLWDINNGRCLKTLEGHTDYVYYGSFTGDGRLVSASHDGTLKVWDLDKEACLATLIDHRGEVQFVSLISEGQIAVSTFGTTQIWDLRSGRCLRTFKGSLFRASPFSITSEGRAVSRAGASIQIWDFTSPECLRQLKGYSHVVVCPCVNDLEIRELRGRRDFRTPPEHAGDINSFSVTSDGLVMSCSADSMLEIRDASTGKCLTTLRRCSGETVTSTSTRLHDRTSRAPETPHVTLWEYVLADGKHLHTREGFEGVRWTGDCVFALEGRIVSSYIDGTMKVWDLKTGACLCTLKGHTRMVGSILLTGDGRLVSRGQDNGLRVWDLARGKCVMTLEGHAGKIRSISMPSEGYLMSCSSGWGIKPQTKLWHLESGECLMTFESYSGIDIVLLATCRRILSHSGTTLKVWDLDSCQCLGTSEDHAGDITSFTVLSEGRAVIRSDKTLKVYDLDNAQCLTTLAGHTDTIDSFSLTSDGHAVSLAGNTLKLWDLNRGKEMACFHGDDFMDCRVFRESCGDELAQASDLDPQTSRGSLVIAVARYSSSVALLQLEEARG